MDLQSLTIKEVHKSLKNKTFSSKELTTSLLDRIEKIEPKIDSYLESTPELALKQAERTDKLIQSNQEISVLSGIPVSVKDVVVTRGIKTTAGSRILENFIPPYSATIYDRLLEENAVILGKTNMDEFAMGSSTENSAFKITKNPWNLNKVPGGSSGGSAASVSSGMATYSIGSDTGGSIRQPAALCGVVGMKPTYGRVSRYGLIAMASSLDQIGPITKTVEDSAIVLNAISGYDPKDSNCIDKKFSDFTASIGKDIKNLKIGVPNEFFDEGVDVKVKNIVEVAIKHLEDLGAKIEEISLPHSREAVAVYYLIMPSEVSANMARFDGIRYGYGRDKFGDEVKRRIMLGTYALSSGYYDDYYLKAAKVRTLIRMEFKEAFEKVNVILGPTSPTVAFDIGEKASNPLQMYLADILSVSQNLAGLPAISIPCGFVDGLPVGLQITGNHWEEEKILNVAHVYEQSTNWHKQNPKL
ncbi:Asp-tRNA(Asn)/Glu-tRNA(Gln) amidotransferase subunit GatA [Patescibacteria group bacterium]|nr:Asp-tRNA(Asn)/Glu-tRNA(Gln) amidotransferase subunit GatA [Patescibacteria group bacterium]